MNNKFFQQIIKAAFALVLALGLIMPASPATVVLAADTTDTQFVNQWSLQANNSTDNWGVDASPAWDVTTGSASTVVAVLDSGILPHEDLDTTIPRILAGYDFISNPANLDGDGRDANPADPGGYEACADSAWQGTLVAGVIGATSNNNLGIAGIDWNAKILPVRVSGNCLAPTAGDLVDGMRWAAGLTVDGVTDNPVANRAKVIHVSAGISGQSCADYQDEIDEITAVGLDEFGNPKPGAVIVAAVGDGGANTAVFPANCNGVITVAATDRNGDRAGISNYGSTVEISAPGADILSTSNNNSVGSPSGDNNNYVNRTSSSMAAAHVSGVVSLMFAANEYITPTQVLQILQTTAFKFADDSTCTTATCGVGILNAGEAVRVTDLPDLIITDVVITNMADAPLKTTDADGDPKLEIGEGEQFKVKISVKNQGGSDSGGAVHGNVYVNRDPMATLVIDETDGALYESGSSLRDVGDFYNPSGSNDIGQNGVGTITVVVDWDELDQSLNGWVGDPVAWGDGTHQLYAYIDASGAIEESYEANNHHSELLEINPYRRGKMLYPLGAIGPDYVPTYMWNKMDNATQYRIYVKKGTRTVFNQWYSAAQICETDQHTCSMSRGPALPLSLASYTWYMQSYGTTGYSAMSAPQAFNLTAPSAPGQPTLTSPAEGAPIVGYNTTFTWNKVEGATKYLLYLKDPAGRYLLKKTYSSASICPLTTCSVASPTLKAGLHTWQVVAYGPGGYGPWSYGSFSTSTELPGQAVLMEPDPFSPDPIDTFTPTFTWSKVDTATAKATSYRLYVTRGRRVVLNKLYSASTYCNNEATPTCSVTSPSLVPGLYTWQVQAYSPAGYGELSAIGTFSTPGVTEQVILTNPIDSEPDNPDNYIPEGYKPDFVWEKVDGATKYRLYVKGPTGRILLNKWYYATSYCTVGTECKVTGPLTLQAGTHTWQVQAYGPAGYSAWSAGTFKTNPNVPDQVTIPVPTVPINDGTLGFIKGYTTDFTWNKNTADMTTHYLLQVWGPTGTRVVNQLFDPSICNSEATPTCTAIKPATMQAGEHTWQVTAYSPAGYGVPSAVQNFKTNEGVPPEVAWTSPLEGAIITNEDSPVYTWQPVDTEEAWATLYRLYVKRGRTTVVNKWISPSACVDIPDDDPDQGSQCTTTGAALSAGTYTWQIIAYNPAGYSPGWTTGTFTISPTAPPVLKFPYVAGKVAEIGTNYNPKYEWYDTGSATHYRLYIKLGRRTILNKWYTAASLCTNTDESGNKVCSYVSPTLKGGTYTWQVQAKGAAGYSAWAGASFNTTLQNLPSGAVLTAPTGDITTQNPVYTWEKVDMATSYRVYVIGPAGRVLDKWVRSIDVCSDDTRECTTTGPTLETGNYTWWLQTYNASGYYGPWLKKTFKVVAP